jgi:hypothetical protein
VVTGFSWVSVPENALLEKTKDPPDTGGLRAVGRGTARYPIMIELIADIADE